MAGGPYLGQMGSLGRWVHRQACIEVATCMGAWSGGAEAQGHARAQVQARAQEQARAQVQARAAGTAFAVRPGQPCCGEGRAPTLVVESLGSRFLRSMGRAGKD